MFSGHKVVRPNVRMKIALLVVAAGLLAAPASAEALSGEGERRIRESKIVSESVGGTLQIEVEPTDDNRSYRISSRQIDQTIGFRPDRPHTIQDVSPLHMKGLTASTSGEDEKSHEWTDLAIVGDQ